MHTCDYIGILFLRVKFVTTFLYKGTVRRPHASDMKIASTVMSKPTELVTNEFPNIGKEY
jgi:hypothetical protein